MMKKNNGRKRPRGLAMFLVAIGLIVAGSRTSLGQIQPYQQNHWYWQYHGKPLLLFGGSDRDNIFQWAGQGTRLTDHLDLLVGCGGNYIRCTMSSREYTAAGHRWDLLPYPFAKLDNGKYDLTQWDTTYWKKLRTFLAETKKRGIIVQLELAVMDDIVFERNIFQRRSRLLTPKLETELTVPE